MLHIKPVTTSVGPRTLLSGAIFTVVLIAVALLIAFILSSLPD